MKVGLFPLSANPWHKGHEDILNKALKVFDHVIICKMTNPEKLAAEGGMCDRLKKITSQKGVSIVVSSETLKEAASQYYLIDEKTIKIIAIIRGLRDGKDFDYEINQQYWNEDIGIKLPFVYFGSNRSLRHVSSSAIRIVEGLGLKHEY